MRASPAGQPAPIAVIDGWTVPIPMPVHHEGPRTGELVGWLSMNKSTIGAKAAANMWRTRKAWRLAARDAYKRCGVPKDLDLIRVQVEIQFPDRTKRDPENFEPTIKPIIDALQPQKEGERWNPKLKRKVPFVDYGWGVIPDDDPEHLIRDGRIVIGTPLGRTNPIKGLVILRIYPARL